MVPTISTEGPLFHALRSGMPLRSFLQNGLGKYIYIYVYMSIFLTERDALVAPVLHAWSIFMTAYSSAFKVLNFVFYVGDYIETPVHGNPHLELTSTLP